MTTVQAESRADSSVQQLSARAVGGLWLLSGALLLAFLGTPPVTRTQEARVLETARQMLGADAHGWLVPVLNGEPRLKKPPLAYWMTAGAYLIGGVSEAVGRAPYVLGGWLTLGLVYSFGKRAFDQKTALASCALLLGSHAFYRQMRLAETDAAATLFLTCALYCLWRGASDRRARWMHLAAAATAMVVLAKGAPAIFVLVFLLVLCLAERRWDMARRFVTSGAPVTLIVLAVPWFVYVHFHQGTDVVWSELQNTAMGGDHPGWPWDYIPSILVAAAPWSLLLPLALFDAFRRWRDDPAKRLVLLWLLAILIPLCINGNKQAHYLLMLTPPMMLLIGRLLVEWPASLDRPLKWIIVGMTIAAGASAVALPIAAPLLREYRISPDWLFGGLLAIATVAMIISIRRAGVRRASLVMLAIVAVLLPLLEGAWVPPTFYVKNPRTAAAQIRQVGTGPYVFLGPSISLPLSFALRSAIPQATSVDDLTRSAVPGTIVLHITKNDAVVPAPGSQFVFKQHLSLARETIDVYRFEPAAQ
jgi:4-amino-4-deoxy-L-arabinose transferase-like glycosyltransferase